MKTTVPSGALVNLRLDQLDDAPDNPRIRFDEASLAQLIDSMSSVGLLHPIVVRALKVAANEPSRFEIVCGHRRRAAAARLQWETIPATVHSLTPAQASDMALVENLQREDLTELEEAEGYSQMVARGQTPDEIAARLGRSESSVLNRLVLVNLPEAATAAMREGRLTASVATLIGRLAGAQQREDATDAVLSEERQEWDPETETTVAIPMSFRSARSMIRRQFMLGLESPPFDADDACLVPASGACGPCRHRTGNQVTLFGDMVAQRGGGEVCTYPPCFDQKRQATVDQVLATAAEAGLATVPAKKAAKIFTSDGYLHHGSGFV
jgi:ParB/RepB/Spo0J family partition protein